MKDCYFVGIMANNYNQCIVFKYVFRLRIRWNNWTTHIQYESINILKYYFGSHFKVSSLIKNNVYEDKLPWLWLFLDYSAPNYFLRAMDLPFLFKRHRSASLLRYNPSLACLNKEWSTADYPFTLLYGLLKVSTVVVKVTAQGGI